MPLPAATLPSPQDSGLKGLAREVEALRGVYMTFKQLRYHISLNSINREVADRVIAAVAHTQHVLPLVIAQELASLASMRFHLESYSEGFVIIYCHAAYLRDEQPRVSASVLVELSKRRGFIRRLCRVSYMHDPRDQGTDAWQPTPEIERMVKNVIGEANPVPKVVPNPKRKAPTPPAAEQSQRKPVKPPAAKPAAQPGQAKPRGEREVKAAQPPAKKPQSRLSKLLGAFRAGQTVFFRALAADGGAGEDGWSEYRDENYKQGLKLNAEGYEWKLQEEFTESLPAQSSSMQYVDVLSPQETNTAAEQSSDMDHGGTMGMVVSEPVQVDPAGQFVASLNAEASQDRYVQLAEDVAAGHHPA